MKSQVTYHSVKICSNSFYSECTASICETNETKFIFLNEGKAFLFPQERNPKILSLLFSKRSQSSKQPLVKSDCSIHNHALWLFCEGPVTWSNSLCAHLETETENCFKDISFRCFKPSHRHALSGGHNVPERISVCTFRGYSLNGFKFSVFAYGKIEEEWK